MPKAIVMNTCPVSIPGKLSQPYIYKRNESLVLLSQNRSAFNYSVDPDQTVSGQDAYWFHSVFGYMVKSKC